jgi:threonyl-tRNA synthetase
MEMGTVSPRFRDGKNLNPMLPADFVGFVEKETKSFR